jgi:hypothetical protein
MRHILTVAFYALVLCAPALAQTAPETGTSLSPASDSNPLTCRIPQTAGSSRLGAVCRANAEWTRYPRYGVSVGAGGFPGPPNFAELTSVAPAPSGCSPVCM